MKPTSKNDGNLSFLNNTDVTNIESKSLDSDYSITLSDLTQSRISSIYKPNKMTEYKKALKQRNLSKVKQLNVRICGVQRQYHCIPFKKKLKPPVHQVKSIRFLDYCFLMDDSYQEFDINLRSDFLVFYSFEQFKRIVKIEFDKNRNIYNYKLEEKYPSQQIWKGMHTISHIKNFLRTQEDLKSDELINLIDIVIAKIESGWMISQTYGDKIHNKRSYLMKLDDECLTTISKLPMIKMTESFDISLAAGTFRSISHNDEFSKLIGYSNYLPTYNDLYNGFHIYAFIYTKDWINYYVKLYKLFMLNLQYMKWSCDDLRIKDTTGNDIPGHFMYYRQTYIDNGQLYEEHYTIFYRQEEPLTNQ